jgi:hypothetical protein
MNMILLIAVAVALLLVIGAYFMWRRMKYKEVLEDWESEYGPTGSNTRSSTKQPMVSQTKSFLEQEVLERFLKEHFLLPINKLQSRKSPTILNKGWSNLWLRSLAWAG